MSVLTSHQALGTLVDALEDAGAPLAIHSISFASRPGTRPMNELHVGRQPHEGPNIINVKGIPIGTASPVIMAGPCSIESREQLLTVATAISQYGRFILRGGRRSNEEHRPTVSGPWHSSPKVPETGGGAVGSGFDHGGDGPGKWSWLPPSRGYPPDRFKKHGKLSAVTRSRCRE